MKYLILFSILINSNLGQAKSKTCSTLNQCIDIVSKLTGKKYIIDSELKGTVKVSNNFTINKENADDFISEVLSINGFTRIPSNNGKWTVINSRDVRYMPTPNYIYGKDKVPNNYDFAMLTIKLKNPFIAAEISRNFRPFMSRYGRIIDIRTPGIVIIIDTGKNINRLLSLVETLDQKPTKDEIKSFEKEKKLKNKIRELKAKNCSDIRNDLDEIKDLVRK